MKNILLHICCAPCAIFPVALLRENAFFVKGVFFNPNIHPLAEYERRLDAVRKYCQEMKLDLGSVLYEPKEFFQAINKQESSPTRCHICWQLRLRHTAQEAKKENFEYFTTTLLGSPYQDTKVLEAIGQEEAKNSGVNFFIADFKAGFRQAHNQAKQAGIYCQNYCGCIYSEIERFKNRKPKTVNRENV